MKNKRLSKISNRCAFSIIAAVMAVSLPLAISIPAHAEELDAEAFQLGEDGSYAIGIEQGNTDTSLSQGTSNPVTTNDVAAGTVVEVNNTKIDTNSGTVNDNKSVIDYNDGTVKDNNGTVNNNMGVVVDNHGSVNNLYESDEFLGRVTNNYDTVTGSGAVTNNYGGTVSDSTSVTNNFWKVTVEEEQNVSSEFSSGFTKVNDDNYLQTKNESGPVIPQGQIKFTPDGDHEIGTKTEEATTTGDGFTYEVAKDDNGIYTATITGLTKNIKVNLNAFNLALYSKKPVGKTEESNSPDQNSQDQDSDNDDDPLKQGTPRIPDGCDELRELLGKAIAVAASGKEQTVYWDKGTSLPSDVMVMLHNNPNVTLVFSYTYHGVPITLTIPGSAVVLNPAVEWYGPAYLYQLYGKGQTAARTVATPIGIAQSSGPQPSMMENAQALLSQLHTREP